MLKTTFINYSISLQTTVSTADQRNDRLRGKMLRRNCDELVIGGKKTLWRITEREITQRVKDAWHSSDLKAAENNSWKVTKLRFRGQTKLSVPTLQ